MRKSLLLSAIMIMFLMTSCEKEPIPEIVSTYQVSNQVSPIDFPLDKLLNGTLYEVIVFCYAGDDIVREDSYEKIAPGTTTKIKEVTTAITKIKISYKILPPASIMYSNSLNNRKYVVSYTLIEIGKNVVGTITDDSMVKAKRLIE